MVPWRWYSICLISFQCLEVGAKLYPMSKFTNNVIFGYVQFVRYINTLIAMRFGISRPNNSLLSSLRQNEFLFISSEWKTWEHLMGVIYSYEITSRLFLYMLIDGLTLYLVGKSSIYKPKSFILNSLVR